MQIGACLEYLSFTTMLSRFRQVDGLLGSITEPCVVHANLQATLDHMDVKV